MKPIQQTIFEPPHGNCLQACVASLLEVPLEEIPNFTDWMNWDDYDDNSWWTKYEDFMEQFGLQPIGIDPNGNWKPRGWHMIVGKSPRHDCDHVIVAYNGEPEHDPYPGGNCELQSKAAYEFFVVVNPCQGRLNEET